MHEMGITQGILSAAFEAAEGAGASRVTAIRVSVGDMTEIVSTALEFAFEALTPGTMAEGATLVITQVGAHSRCNDCGIEYDHDRFQMLCPECGSFNVELLHGRELQIDSIDTEDEAPAEPVAEDTAE